MTLTRNFWDGFGQGLLIFGLVFGFFDPLAGHSPFKSDVGFWTLAVGCLIRPLGLRFAPQGDKGFVLGFLFSWPVHLETDLSSITTSVPLAVL